MAEADVIIGCSGGSDPLLPEQIPLATTRFLIWRFRVTLTRRSLICRMLS